MISSKAFAAQSPTSPLAPFTLIRREPGADEVHISIAYCGVCQTDLHCARDEWGGQPFPVVPGHEIVGTVTRVGSDVTKFKRGDRVGVGCMVGSCGVCSPCDHDMQQHCENGTTFTYGSPYTHGMADPGTTHTLGGYSQSITVSERFVVRVPDSLDLAAAAPLLCAGITMYSPLRRYGVGPGKRLAIVGLGGVGHIGVKIAVAMGAEVTVITTRTDKANEALALGAHAVIVSNDGTQMTAAAKSFHLIFDTVGAKHAIGSYLELLKFEGAMVMIGLPVDPLTLHVFSLSGSRRSLTASLMGGLEETQEMLDFCAANNIAADIELIPIQGINEAFDRMLSGDVKYRFVIDNSSLAL